MTGIENRVLAIVAVRCARCAAEYGQGSLLGQMSLWPEHLGGGWRWRRADRLKVYPDGRRATQLTNADDQIGGGAEARCRRCGSRPRFKVATLGSQAESVRHAQRPTLLI